MNGNANGSNQLKRMEFEYKNTSYSFSINPEVYDMKMQNRANVRYTKGGAFVEMFGEGLKEISIVGTTGFKGNTEDRDFGFKKFLELKQIFETVVNDVEDGKEVTDFLNFYNHTDGEAYVTIPMKMNISRNVSQPLLYKYDILLYAIRRVGDPVPQPNIQVIGNPLGTPTTASETVKDRDEVEKEGAKEGSSFTEPNKKESKKTVSEGSKELNKNVFAVENIKSNNLTLYLGNDK